MPIIRLPAHRSGPIRAATAAESLAGLRGDIASPPDGVMAAIKDQIFENRKFDDDQSNRMPAHITAPALLHGNHPDTNINNNFITVISPVASDFAVCAMVIYCDDSYVEAKIRTSGGAVLADELVVSAYDWENSLDLNANSGNFVLPAGEGVEACGVISRNFYIFLIGGFL